jgi:hypothetical protein
MVEIQIQTNVPRAGRWFGFGIARAALFQIHERKSRTSIILPECSAKVEIEPAFI